MRGEMDLWFNVHDVHVEVRLREETRVLAEHLLADFGVFQLREPVPRADLSFDFLPSDSATATAKPGAIGLPCDLAPAPYKLWTSVVRPQFTPRITERLTARGDTVLLHASAAARGGKGLAFVGEKGAGKSSLCYLLVKEGFRYVSNDLLYLQKSGNASLCLGLPQELTLGASALLWFDDEKRQHHANLAGELVQRHGTDHATKATLRHERAVMETHASLRTLIFPEPALGLTGPRLRRLTPDETVQKLVANTQSCVRWGFSPKIPANDYLRTLCSVVEGVANDPSVNSYLFQWTWDHDRNLEALREILE